MLSDAFLYLQKISPENDFHNINHLMHYGTVIKEGNELIDNLLNTGHEGNIGPNDLSIKIAKIQEEHISEKRISIRKNAEDGARALMEEKVGHFDKEDIKEFFKLMNQDFWQGKTRNDRFGLAYIGKNLNVLTEQIDAVNEWMEMFWTASESELKSHIDKYYKEKPIKNAGTAFPSMILYLRDSSKFNLCFKLMVKGLSILTDFSDKGYSGKFYFNYNNEVNNLKNDFSLLPQEVDIILSVIGKNGNGPYPERPFSPKTFELLKGLHENPIRDFYNKHKDDFKTYLENPFQDLLRKVAQKLPLQMIDYLEVNKGLFSRILKNDWGKGGAWDFYWGALYPKGGKRISDPQLFMWINRDRLEFGFYIGEYGSDQRNRFIRNTQANHKILYNILNESFADSNVQYGEREEFVGGTKGVGINERRPSLQDWLKNPEEAGIHAAVFHPKEEVLQHSTEHFLEEIVQTYQALFPLILLAIHDDPMPAIADYIGKEKSDELNPEYPLSEFAKNTGFRESYLERWVRAIERKGQIIIYGPPGTGKTYMAEHLAQHLIGGGYGFSEIVQFHPAYAYEDFIQGIRPKAKGDGQLDYPVLPGRFLGFCEKAKGCKDLCVLIVDEINRANLARVFGELMYLLEYRDREVPLSSGGVFRIPDNVRIIGTMNTADRSIALVDHALRRRFAFLALYPDYKIIKRYHSNKETGFPVEDLIEILKDLNGRIADRNYEIGVSFFLRKDISEQIKDIWSMEIEPYLEEYFFDQPAKVEEFRWAKIAERILG